MKKVLFIGIERYFMMSLIRCLPEEKKQTVHELLANSQEDVIQTAKENPDISIVLFLGYLLGTGSKDPFLANVEVAVELGKILPKMTMIAATGHEVDELLMENGCTVRIPVMDVGRRLREIL